MNNDAERLLNPELVEEDYTAAVQIFRNYASGVSQFTLRELRGHFETNRVAVPSSAEDFTDLVDEMRTDVVDSYHAQEPPVEVDWLALRDERGRRQYTLGVVQRDESGRRSLQSPVSLILRHTVSQQIGQSPTTAPAPKESAATETVQPDRQRSERPEAPSDTTQDMLTARERDLLGLIRTGIDHHRKGLMRPHWIENALGQLGYKPDIVHGVLRKAEDAGLLHVVTHNSQLYYATDPEEVEPGASTRPIEQQGRNLRNLTGQELTVATDLLDELAGHRTDTPSARKLRTLISEYQGQISKPAMRKLLRALEGEGLIESFVDERVRRSAAQQVKIGSQARNDWHSDRESVTETLRSLKVKP